MNMEWFVQGLEDGFRDKTIELPDRVPGTSWNEDRVKQESYDYGNRAGRVMRTEMIAEIQNATRER